MKPCVKKFYSDDEFETNERCFITETGNNLDDEEVSISRARVEPGITTAWHQLTGTAERYLIISGIGEVELDFADAIKIFPGDIVKIPPGIPQRIRNIGDIDLLFYCICSPRFQEKNYINLE